MSKDIKPQDKQADAETADQVTELLTDTSSDSSTESVADVKQPTKLAKAGKRSAKAVSEAEAEAERKAKAADDTPKTTAPKPAQRNPLKVHGKAYRQVAELIESGKQYELMEAIELAKKTAKVKFDASLELHINLGVDPKQADQMVRSSVVLPSGTGKSRRVAVLTSGDKQKAAREAGADVVGDTDLMAQIEKGKIDFDLLIATPDVMPKLSKLAKILGPKGLMPNPKSGTVTNDVSKMVKEAKAGRVEFRIDKQAIVHQAIGKVSFKTPQLLDNAKVFIDAVMKVKPAAAKGTYVKAISMATTMGPGIKLDVTKALVESNPKK